MVSSLRYQPEKKLVGKKATEWKATESEQTPVVVKARYSLSLFNHFCPVKRNGKYFAKEWSEQKVLVIEVVGLYSSYQKYKRIGVPSSYQFGENWT